MLIAKRCVDVAGDDSLITESVQKVSLDFKSRRLPNPMSPIRDEATQIPSHPHGKRGNSKLIIINSMPPCH